MSIGIRALGYHLGEQTLDAAQLAHMMSLPEDVIRASIGDGLVRVSSDSSVTLACRASMTCLARAGVAPDQIDALVLFDTRLTKAGEHAPIKFHQEFGVKNAFVVYVGSDCSDSPTALAAAQDLIRAKRARRVLVACGSSWSRRPGFERRVIGEITATNHRDVFSDGGAAALVEDCAPGEGIELLGFGFATDGQHAEHVAELLDHDAGRSAHGPRLSDVNLAYDALTMNALARDRCLRDAGLQASDIDCLLFPQEASGLPKWFAKHLGFVNERLVYYTDVSHVGASDPLLGIERLQRTARRGLTVLVAARSFAAMRFVALRF
jgi:3-oxoacyl-[acyl-carrier-protein] synthase-3